MRFEPSIDNEEQHIAEMAAFFREQVESKKHLGMLVLFASGRAMQRFLDYVTDLRLMLLVQGDQPRYRLVELHRKRVANGERSVLVGLQSFAEGLDLKGDLLSPGAYPQNRFSAHRQPGGDHRRGMAEKPQPLSV